MSDIQCEICGDPRCHHKTILSMTTSKLRCDNDHLKAENEQLKKYMNDVHGIDAAIQSENLSLLSMLERMERTINNCSKVLIDADMVGGCDEARMDVKKTLAEFREWKAGRK